MRIELRPSVLADFQKLIGRLPAHRAQCLTALADGNVLGIGAFLGYPDGRIWASVVMAEAARRYPFAIHRAGVMAMRFAQAQRYGEVYATAQPGNPAAERWLVRLGFKPTVIDGTNAFVWQRRAIADVE